LARIKVSQLRRLLVGCGQFRTLKGSVAHQNFRPSHQHLPWTIWCSLVAVVVAVKSLAAEAQAAYDARSRQQGVAERWKPRFRLW
jgi:hypothetical protein